MVVIRTSTGTVQEVAGEDGPMTTDAGSRQYGLADPVVIGATPIPGADTYFYPSPAGMQEVSPTAGAAYDADAVALWSGYNPSAARRRIISDIYVQAKDLGINFSAMFDALYVLGGGLDDPGYTTPQDREFCRRNWAQRAYDLVEIDSANLSFVTDVGFTGNGVSSKLNSTFNPTTAPSPKFTQASGSLGFWSHTSPQGGVDMGNGNSVIACRNVSNEFTHRINAASSGGVTGMMDGAGLYVSSRVDAATCIPYKDGIPALPVGTPVGANQAPLNEVIHILGRSGGAPAFSARTGSFAFIGRGVTAQEVANVHTVFS